MFLIEDSLIHFNEDDEDDNDDDEDNNDDDDDDEDDNDGNRIRQHSVNTVSICTLHSNNDDM